MIEMEHSKSKYNGKIGKQYKSLPMDVKEMSFDSRKISGYAAIFGNVDKAGDLLVKGCFARSIEERGPNSSANDKIIFLYMHDMREPIGRITVLKEDDRGLYFEAEIDDVERGNQALKQLESGTLNQFSIGYRYVWDNCQWDDVRDCLIVKEVILFEVSVVSIGCNGETEYLGLKSEQIDDKFEELQKEMSSFCKSLNSYKQSDFHRIVSKAMSLASIKPGKPFKEEVEGEKTKSLFDRIKTK